MNLLRIAMLSLLVVFFVAGAHADQIPIVIDPVIKTGGVPDPAVPASIITTSFTIESPTGTSPGVDSAFLLFQFGTLTSTSPACFFENNINPSGAGEAITQLSFDISGVSPGTVSCGFLTGSPFAGCGVSPLAGGGTEVQFTQGSIPYHSDFTLEFQGFPKNTSFTATASPTPEPASIVLLLSGAGALFVRRKLRSR